MADKAERKGRAATAKADKGEKPAKGKAEATPNIPRVPARLRARFRAEIAPALMRQFNYGNRMQVPEIKKVVVNMGLGEAVANVKVIDAAVAEMAAITGQKPVVKFSVTDPNNSNEPYDIKTDPHFTALDEIRSELFFREVWDSWIGCALSERNSILERALREGLGLTTLRDLARILRQSAPAIRALPCDAPPDEKEIQERIHDKLQQGRGLLGTSLTSGDKLVGYLENAISWLKNPDSPKPTKPGNAGSAANWKQGKKSLDEVRAFIREVADFGDSFHKLPVQRLLNETIQWIRKEFMREWDNRKRAGGLLDFDDQLWLARDLLLHLASTGVPAATEALAAAALDALDDVELARRVGARDERAFELLMRRHNQMLYRIARSILRDDADAEDAVQEAYLAAFRNIAGFRGGSRLSTWLARVVINESYGRLRKRKRAGVVLPFDALADARDAGERAAEEGVMSETNAEQPDAFRISRAEKRFQLSFYGCCQCRRHVVGGDGNGEITLPDHCR